MTDSYDFNVDLNSFNGPLNLLLDLAKSQKVDLEKISITMLADQFLQFIKDNQNLNLETASEYLLMATWLAYLKSKLLLPDDDDDDFKALEVAEKLKLQLKKLELIRLLSDQLLKRERIGKTIFYRGMKGGIRSINNTVYKLTLYDLLKSYSGIKVQSLYQTINIPKLPVMTTQEGIKEIKNKMTEIDDWKKIQDLIPKTFKTSINFKKTGLASVFSASLELVKDGVVNLMQDNLFDDIYIITAKHTPLKLKEK